MNRIFFVSILFVIGTFTILQGQVTVDIPSITVDKNEVFSLQLPINFQENSTIDSIRFSFKFNPQVVTLLSAKPVVPTVIPCPEFTINQIYTSPDQMQVFLTCKTSFTGAMNQLLALEFQALAGKDSTTTFQLETIEQNGVNIPVPNGTRGTITVRNNKQVLQSFPEFLGQNFPNPFSSTSEFKYSINQTTAVVFTVFNSKGETILKFPEITRLRGEYSFLLNMDPWEYASGTYSLQMETNEGVYFQNFLYLK